MLSDRTDVFTLINQISSETFKCICCNTHRSSESPRQRGSKCMLWWRAVYLLEKQQTLYEASQSYINMQFSPIITKMHRYFCLSDLFSFICAQPHFFLCLLRSGHHHCTHRPWLEIYLKSPRSIDWQAHSNRCSSMRIRGNTWSELPELSSKYFTAISLTPPNQIKNAFRHWSPDACRLIITQKAAWLRFCSARVHSPSCHTPPYKSIDLHSNSWIHVNH